MKSTRRKVIKSLAILGVTAYSSNLWLDKAFADSGLVPVAVDNATAKMLGYSEDHTKVDTIKYPRKAGQDNMKCSTCLLFLPLAEAETVSGGKEKKDWGKCSIFPNMVVAASGWCNSWSQKS